MSAPTRALLPILQLQPPPLSQCYQGGFAQFVPKSVQRHSTAFRRGHVWEPHSALGGFSEPGSKLFQQQTTFGLTELPGASFDAVRVTVRLTTSVPHHPTHKPTGTGCTICQGQMCNVKSALWWTSGDRWKKAHKVFEIAAAGSWWDIFLFISAAIRLLFYVSLTKVVAFNSQKEGRMGDV